MKRILSGKPVLCSVLFIAALCGATHANAIIVAKSGGNYPTIQQGLGAANAGDTVFVKAGTYTETVSFGKSGSATAPIVLMNFGTDAPVIDGNGTSGNVVSISGRSNVQIIGFEVMNASGGDPSIGISVEGSGSNILIKNCTVHDIASDNKNAHGIAAYGSSATTPIRRLVLDGNEVYNCKLGQSESVVLNGNVDSFTVINNTVHDNDNIGIDFIGFEGTASANDQARDGLCAGNHVYNISSKTNPTYGGEQSADGIYVDGGKGIVIERNIVDNCDIGVEVASEHGGKITSDITVRDNFLSRSYQANVLTGGYDATRGNASNIFIVNNTTYQGNDGEVVLQFNNSGITVENNILIAKSGSPYVSASGTNNSGITVDNNMYYGASTSSAGDWTDAHAKFGNPQLVGAPSNMHLTAASTAINAGAALTNGISGTLDIDSQPRVSDNTIDIGADEFVSSKVFFTSNKTARSSARLEKVSFSKWRYCYSPADPASVSYEVFGLDGRVLSTSKAVDRQTGQHSLLIDCGNLASKACFVRIEQGAFMQTFALPAIR
jgi:hypothetical protein